MSRRILSNSATVVAALACVSLLLLTPSASFADKAATAATGAGQGILVPGERGNCPFDLFNADGSYENGYAWQYGGIVAPEYGAFADCYNGPLSVCGVLLDLSQVGNQNGQTLDAYIWDDAAGSPGAVACVVVGVDPGPVAFWPSLSRHLIDLGVTCETTGNLWAGYWANWPGSVAGWFIGADTDGFGGCPYTNYAPGIGFPTGWGNVSAAWGPTQALAIGVSNVEIGTMFGACCLPDGSCVIREEPQCEGEYQGGGTNCNPNDCPQPPEGACCRAVDGACTIRTERECIDLGDQYLGDDVSCVPNPCPQPPEGACCNALEGTCIFTTVTVCNDLGDTYLGDDIPCDPNPCPQPVRACCFEDTSCLVLLIEDCVTQGGVFVSDVTSCDPNPCDMTGACCFGDACVQEVLGACLDDGGIFLGEGIPCDANACLTLDCDGTPVTLAEAGFVGDLSEIPPGEPVGLGHGRGRVVDTAQRGCGELVFNADATYENGYAWQYGGQLPTCFGSLAERYEVGGATICGITLDLSQVGNQNGQLLDAYVWQDIGGIPGAVIQVAVDVDPGPIAFWPSLSRHEIAINASPTGSAWWVGYWGQWPETVAAWFVGADTDGPGGKPYTYVAPGLGFPTGWNNVSIAWGPTQALGIGATVLVDGAGACCFPDGTCEIRRFDTCDDEFLGEDTECTPNPCPQPPSGACCFADGSCSFVSFFACEDLGGDYLGDDIACDANPCPQPPDGACCFADGSCQFLNAFECEDVLGSYFGDGVECDPNPCPQPDFGACCLPDQSCMEMFDFACDDAGGTFQGAGTACADTDCPIPCNAPLTMRTGIQRSPEPGLARGPHAGGTLILHHDSELAYTSDGQFCESSLGTCEDAITRVDEEGPVVFQVLAAFHNGSAPRLAGVTFGVAYPQCLIVLDGGPCGDFELPQSNWPDSGTGTAVTWSTAQEASLTTVYWFAGYVDSGQAASFDLIPHPTQGANFADDDVPANLDPIAGLGSLGFKTDGFRPCPGASSPGACCLPDGSCVVVLSTDCTGDFQGDGTQCDPNPCSQPVVGACCFTEGDCEVLPLEDCEGAGGAYQGDDTACDPNPCDIVPTIERSWGEIKAQFR